MKNKLKLFWEFYKSHFVISLSIFVFYLFFCPSYFVFLIPFVSIIAIWIHKEFSGKNEYFFYFNNQIPKWQLFTFCFIMNSLISIVFSLLL